MKNRQGGEIQIGQEGTEKLKKRGMKVSMGSFLGNEQGNFQELFHCLLG